MITEQALEGYRQYTEDIIKSAEVKIDGVYYPLAIQKKERLPDGSIAVYLSIDRQEESTISEIRVLNNNDDVWLVKTENIKAVQEGLLYRFIIEIGEDKG